MWHAGACGGIAGAAAAAAAAAAGPALEPLLPQHTCCDYFTHSPCFPLAAAGEYAMLKAAAERGWLNEKDAVLEALLCLKRAGSGEKAWFASSGHGCGMGD